MKKPGVFSIILACLALGLALASCTNPTVNSPTTYTVTFNANGGSGTAPSQQKVQEGFGITLPNEGGLSRSGYTFGGWNTSASGTGTGYSAGSSYTPTGDVTLYAKWNAVAVTYTVSFSANGGSGTPPSAQTVSAGSSITLRDGSGLSRTGYIFGGWNTNVSGTGTNYTSGSSYTPSGDITLYAKWDTEGTANYTVTFNANGGSGTTPAAQTAVSGSSIILPGGNGLSRTGFTFGGWNTDQAGTGTTYQSGDSYTPTAHITLYAKWDNAAVTTYHTVNFSANGGSGTPPSAQTVQAGSSVTLPNEGSLTKNGYTFGGWNTNVAGTGTNYQNSDSYTPTANSTLYAKWDAVVVTTYTVTFDINGGNGTVPNPQTVQDGSSITLPDRNGLFRSNHSFGGWNTNSDGTGMSYAVGSPYTPTGDITLYIKWVELGSARELTVAMWDNSKDGWDTNAALRINVNGTNLLQNARLASGGGPEYFYFNVNVGDTVQFFWVNGAQYDRECAFAVYYSDDPPNPSFNPSTGTSDSSRVLISKRYNSPSGAVGNGVSMGSFTAGGTSGTPVPTVTSVTVSPPTASVQKGNTQSLSASVEGTNNPSQNVTWSIIQTNKHSDTNINTSGLLTVSASETLTTLTIRATSTVDTSKYGDAAITVTAEQQTVSPDRIEYYWIDQHGNLATTSDGVTSIAPGATLTITAQGTGYVVRQWYLNGINTGQSGNTFNFSSTTTGTHIVDLFVEKDDKVYNTTITITVQ